MATYFRILAWKIPWIEEPGRLVRGVTEWATTEQLKNSNNNPVMPFGQRKQSLALQSHFGGSLIKGLGSSPEDRESFGVRIPVTPRGAVTASLDPLGGHFLKANRDYST